MNDNIPNVLYHYCSLQGLKGIIKRRCLWMTSVFWMDDTTEFFWLYEVVIRVLNQRPSEERNTLHERFEKLMKDRRLSHVFCTCFSADSDSRSQWLEYADDGHGFAIGFDPTAFDLTRAEPVRDVKLESVIYDSMQQERIAGEIIDHLQTRRNDVDEFNLFFARHNTWWQAARCKNSAFTDEKEWRLIFRDDPGEGLHFHERSGRQLIPHIEFRFDPAKNPIHEIWMGPRNDSQRNVDAVEALLRINGYDVHHVKFRGSEIPLRADY